MPNPLNMVHSFSSPIGEVFLTSQVSERYTFREDNFRDLRAVFVMASSWFAERLSNQKRKHSKFSPPSNNPSEFLNRLADPILLNRPCPSLEKGKLHSDNLFTVAFPSLAARE